eukprot:TRINITY_DN41736_c0_g1_i5.p1 TRINITY_DN41736_c0_g1~~TRINITY_DN41736_c0_g1_i5.p1  ORF type:complete len:2632 (+),score=551.81 TRINITY_DN41736_c0_g1_i5:51-7946(+)
MPECFGSRAAPRQKARPSARAKPLGSVAMQSSWAPSMSVAKVAAGLSRRALLVLSTVSVAVGYQVEEWATPATVEAAAASPMVTHDVYGSLIAAGTQFKVTVSGNWFHTNNDKILFVPPGTACPPINLDFPLGKPGTMQEFEWKNCAGIGSDSNTLICEGFSIYRPGIWGVCICDSDRNISAHMTPEAYNSIFPPGSPERGNATQKLCSSKERYVLGGPNIGTFTITGPSWLGELQWRIGAPTNLLISGTGMGAGDRIRIVSGDVDCKNPAADKRMHPNVRAPLSPSGIPDGPRDLTWSSAYESKWEAISIMVAGTYQICWCGNDYGGCDSHEDYLIQVGTVVAHGPSPVADHNLCITGVLCVVELFGTGLSDWDRIRIVEMHQTCGYAGASRMSHAVLQGGYDTRTSGRDDVSRWGGIIMQRSGSYQVCWCGNMKENCDDCCQDDEDFNILARNLTVRGAQQGRLHRPEIGIPFSYVVEGYGLSDVDRISIIDGTTLCGTEDANKFSDGVWPRTSPIGPPDEVTGESNMNRTAIAWQGVMLTKMKEYRVCWCARFYGGCRQGHHFALDIGLISPKGPLNATTLEVVPGKPFELRVLAQPGSILSIDDRMRIVKPHIVKNQCGLSGTLTHDPAVSIRSCWPTCVDTPVSSAAVIKDGGSVEVWDPVLLTKSGTYWICWCNNGHGDCSSDIDFVTQIGVIVAKGVDVDQQWRCGAYLPCSLTVPFQDGVTADDAIQIVSTDSNADPCGLAARVNSAFFSMGSRVSGYEDLDTKGKKIMRFDIGEPLQPGYFRVCYCQAQGTCEQDLDFFQELGTVTVEGISSRDVRHVCYLRDECDVTVLGNRLSPEDSLMLTDPRDKCGLGWDNSGGNFDGEGFSAEDGSRLYIGGLTGVSDEGLERWVFELGKPLRSGRYKLCYCSRARAEGGTCARRSNFDMEAGELYVRGSDFEILRQCQQGEPCTITIRGHIVDRDDRILLYRNNYTCGDPDPRAYPEWMLPTPPDSVGPDNLIPELYKEVYRLDSVFEPGTYHICYCAHLRGASSCLNPTVSNPLYPNHARFAHKAGTLEVEGTIAAVMPVTVNENGTQAPLPASPYAVSVLVDALYPGIFFTCVATDKLPPYIPRPSDLENCTTLPTQRVGVSERAKLMPLCYGKGQSMDASKMGPNVVHIPLDIEPHEAVVMTRLRIWCYAKELCSNDRCAMPASKEGLVQMMTGGLRSTTSNWRATVGTPYSLRVGLSADYNPAGEWARIKVVETGPTCNNALLYHGAAGLQCVESGMGKCEPPPLSTLGTGAWGSSRELVWNNIKVKKNGVFNVCYCDRHDYRACLAWVEAGTLDVTGPDDIGYTNFVANPGKQFDLVIKGRGLLMADRIRLVPKGLYCTSVGSGPRTTTPEPVFVPPMSDDESSTTESGGGRRLGIIHWSDAPIFANSSMERWQMLVEEAGEYKVCWCGSQFRSCSLAEDFTVDVGTLSVVDKKDCELSDWWVLEECTKKCGGGKVRFRRSIRTHPEGGGKECPSADAMIKEEDCNMEPCPLARVDSFRTVPESVHSMEPFQLFVNGMWLDAADDRILLLSEVSSCGNNVQHFGGAACDAGSELNEQELICGDGTNSIKVLRPGRYRVCFCDATSSVTRSHDGTANVSTGSFDALGMTASGCADSSHYLLTPANGAILTVGNPKQGGVPSGLRSDQDVMNPGVARLPGEDDSLSPVAIAGLGALAAVMFSFILGGCCWKWRHYRRLNKEEEEDEVKQVALEKGVLLGLAANTGVSQPSNAVGPDPSTLAWYENYYRSLGYPPGTAALALAGGQGPVPEILALPDTAPPMPPQGHLALMPPPQVPGRPPPPPTPPPYALPAPTPPRSPRSVSPRGVSPRALQRGAPGSKSFGDLVSAANNRPSTRDSDRSFLDMDLSPLPTPTCTPRATTPLALEDSPSAAAAADTPAKEEPVDLTANGRRSLPPIWESSIDSPQKPQDATSPENDSTRPASLADRPETEADSARRPYTGESQHTVRSEVSLALSESSAGDMTARDSKKDGKDASPLTTSALKAHESSFEGDAVPGFGAPEPSPAAPAVEPPGADGPTPRESDASGATPRAVKDLLGDKLSQLIGSEKEDEKAKEEEEERRRQQEADRLKAEEEERQRKEAEAAQQAAEAAELARKEEEEKQRREAEEERLRKEQEERKRREAEEERLRQEEEEKKRREAEEERLRKEQEERKRREAEEERLRQEEEEKKRREAEEERLRQEEEERTRREEEEKKEEAPPPPVEAPKKLSLAEKMALRVKSATENRSPRTPMAPGSGGLSARSTGGGLASKVLANLEKSSNERTSPTKEEPKTEEAPPPEPEEPPAEPEESAPPPPMNLPPPPPSKSLRPQSAMPTASRAATSLGPPAEDSGKSEDEAGDGGLPAAFGSGAPPPPPPSQDAWGAAPNSHSLGGLANSYGKGSEDEGLPPPPGGKPPLGPGGLPAGLPPFGGLSVDTDDLENTLNSNSSMGSMNLPPPPGSVGSPSGGRAKRSLGGLAKTSKMGLLGQPAAAAPPAPSPSKQKATRYVIAPDNKSHHRPDEPAPPPGGLPPPPGAGRVPASPMSSSSPMGLPGPPGPPGSSPMAMRGSLGSLPGPPSPMDSRQGSKGSSATLR